MAQKYVSLHVTPEARDTLRRSALRASGQAGRPISMSERLLTALAAADRWETRNAPSEPDGDQP